MAVPSELTLIGSLLAIGAFLGLTVGTMTYLRKRQQSLDPHVRDRIDGDPLYADGRVNELLYAHRPEYDADGLDVDPDSVRTTSCSNCGTLNRFGYTYCRQCGENLES